MKRTLLCSLAILSLVGCAPTQYRKTVTVTKDANGKIQNIQVVEEIIQSYKEGVKTPKYLDE